MFVTFDSHQYCKKLSYIDMKTEIIVVIKFDGNRNVREKVKL